MPDFDAPNNPSRRLITFCDDCEEGSSNKAKRLFEMDFLALENGRVKEVLRRETIELRRL